MMNNCIFYLPYSLEENGSGARMLRPRKMIQAFKDIGYNVFVIEGHTSQRKALIKELKQNIKKGTTYDFMYSESSTMPTLLTDPKHFPLHPFFDYNFFKYINKNGIPIGLFYCDVYWMFESYGEDLSYWKRKGALLFYKYDLIEYTKYLTAFFVPDIKMCGYINKDYLISIAYELPPGADDIIVEEGITSIRSFFDKPLKVFYVGGIGNHYQIVDLVKAISKTEKTELVICCRQKEWDNNKLLFEPYINDRIEIVHKNSNELESYYRDADICSLMFLPDAYREMAKPFKAFEYLANELPVLSTKGTAIGDFVEKNGIGWNIEFSEDSIIDTLQHILNNPDDLINKKNNCAIVKRNHLWTNRAKQVVNILNNR